MTFSQKLLYGLYAVGISIGLTLVEFFVIRNYISIFSDSWKMELAILLFFILIINPIIDKLIMDKIPFKVKGLIKSQIKKTNPHDIKA